MLVKKITVILLLVLYSASTIGATINMHYCMNKFAGFSFKEIKKDKCPICGMKNTGCCKDEKKQIKINLDQQKADLQFSIHFQPVVVNNTLQFEQFSNYVHFKNQGWINLHAPPILLNIDSQAYLASFLI